LALKNVVFVKNKTDLNH